MNWVGGKRSGVELTDVKKKQKNFFDKCKRSCKTSRGTESKDAILLGTGLFISPGKYKTHHDRINGASLVDLMVNKARSAPSKRVGILDDIARDTSQQCDRQQSSADHECGAQTGSGSAHLMFCIPGFAWPITLLINKSDYFHQVKNVLSQHSGLPAATIQQFVRHEETPGPGRIIDWQSTPEDLGLVDQSVIDVILEAEDSIKPLQENGTTKTDEGATDTKENKDGNLPDKSQPAEPAEQRSGSQATITLDSKPLQQTIDSTEPRNDSVGSRKSLQHSESPSGQQNLDVDDRAETRTPAPSTPSFPLTLVYLEGARGRAEVIRLILNCVGVAYDDKGVARTEWKDMKSISPTGALPMLYIDRSTILSGGRTIARYLAREYGLCFGDPWLDSRIDMLVDGVEDMRVLEFEILIRANMKSDVAAEEFIKERELKVTPFLDLYTKFLASNNAGWFVGDKFSWADLSIFELITAFENVFDDHLLDRHEALKGFVIKVSEIPAINDYLARRPPAPY